MLSRQLNEIAGKCPAAQNYLINMAAAMMSNSIVAIASSKSSWLSNL